MKEKTRREMIKTLRVIRGALSELDFDLKAAHSDREVMMAMDDIIAGVGRMKDTYKQGEAV